MSKLKTKIEGRIMRTYLDLERIRCNVTIEEDRELIRQTMDQLSEVMSFVVKNYPDRRIMDRIPSDKPDTIDA